MNVGRCPLFSHLAFTTWSNSSTSLNPTTTTQTTIVNNHLSKQRMRVPLTSRLHQTLIHFHPAHFPTRAATYLFPPPRPNRKMTAATFSSNYDPEKGTEDLRTLLRANGGKWSLNENGKGVERSFKFKTFKKTWVCFPNKIHAAIVWPNMQKGRAWIADISRNSWTS